MLLVDYCTLQPLCCHERFPFCVQEDFFVYDLFSRLTIVNLVSHMRARDISAHPRLIDRSIDCDRFYSE